MNISENSYQNQGRRCIFICFLMSILLGGCQSLSNRYANYKAETTFDAVETNEFSLNHQQDVVGIIASIQTHENDTLPDIARHFGLGYNDITIANSHIDPWLPEPGSQVLLPIRFIVPDVKRRGLVLNLANMRLFHFPRQQPSRVITYPIGIGRRGWSTPTGLTKITAKKKNPVWRVPASIRKEYAKKGDPLPRIVPAGPDNPLGNYAMRLGIPSYLIHGTNKPYGVGMKISHGCVRLYPEDIAELFPQISVGTFVNIIDQPYLLGWENNMLFLEAHKPSQQHKTIKKKLLKKLKRISRKKDITIDWQKVEHILEQAKGIPIPVLNNSPDFASLANTALSLTHPSRFYQQPVVKPLTRDDWSITVATFSDADAAQKLVAVLNHQGPPIPARRIEEDGLYNVVAGPFQSKEEVQSVIVKIRREFEYTGVANQPQPEMIENVKQSKIIEDVKQSEWNWNWLGKVKQYVMQPQGMNND